MLSISEALRASTAISDTAAAQLGSGTSLSRQSCPWAAVYYEQLRTRGKNHACALRSLGQRWLKILWKMWQTGTRYDAELHARNQLKHGS